MALKLVSAPTTYPVTIDQAKLHCRIDSDGEDALVEIYLAAAVAHVDGPDGFLGRALIDQTWDLYLDEFPDDDEAIKIPLPPLISVTGVYYQDADGDETEFSAASYVVDSSRAPATISLADSVAWPSTNDVAAAVRIRFRAGYTDGNSPATATVPAAIKAAILLTVGSLYEYRETMVIGQTVAQMPWSAEQLLRPYRVHTAMA